MIGFETHVCVKHTLIYLLSMFESQEMQICFKSALFLLFRRFLQTLCIFLANGALRCIFEASWMSLSTAQMSANGPGTFVVAHPCLDASAGSERISRLDLW